MRKTLWTIALGTLVGCGSGKDEGTTAATTPAPAQDGTPAAPGGDGKPVTLTAEQGLQLAKKLIEKRELQNALQVLTQVIKAKPTYADAYLQRANLLSAANRNTLAIEDLSAAVKLQPDNAKTWNSRGFLYLMQRDFPKALADFEKATSLDTNYAQAINNRGLVRIAQEQFEVAMKDFEAALRIDPKYFDAENNRGFALLKLNRKDEAITAFTSAVTINPNYVNGFANRGQAYMETEQFDRAVSDFSKLISLQPGMLAFYKLRADAYRKLGQTSEAARDQAHVEWTQQLVALNRDLAKDQKSPAHWVARGRHLLIGEKYSEAAADFDRALAIDADHIGGQLGRATVWARQGKAAEAIQACTVLIEKRNDLEARSLRGDLYLQQKQFDAAIADYEVAQRFDSQVAEAYKGRAAQYQANGQIQQASADLAQAAALDPKLRSANYEVPAGQQASDARPFQNQK
jgi:tetratricopeptide (TPR) repeat protein